jgi:hypothetical protein
MVAQKPRNIRTAAIVGTLAVALTGTGSAVVWAAGGDPPNNGQSQSSTGPGNSEGKGKSEGKANKVRPDKAKRGQTLHSESVVKNSDGSFQTVVSQHGTVESVSESSITVKSEDGFNQTYVINAETKITKLPALGADGAPPTDGTGKRVKPSTITPGEIKAGDPVRIGGVRDGDTVRAEKILDGVAPDGPGQGMGFGRGHGNKPGKAEGKTTP